MPAYTMRDAPSELLTSAEVAKLLRVHPKQIYRLLGRGLPGHRVGSEWRFSREEVLAWSGVSSEPRPRVTAPPNDEPSSAPALLGANGDRVVEVLLERLAAADKPLIGLVTCDRGHALAWLAARKILLAGFHGEVPPSHTGKERLARIHLVQREVGLAFRGEARLRRVSDLAGKRIGLRPPSAGIRGAFDRALIASRSSISSLGATTRVHASHRDVVSALLRDEVDVALTTAAWAERSGLRFLALENESYDLLLHASDLGAAAVVGVCEVAQSASFQKALGAIAGYDPRGAGAIRYED